jgi:hypothetical protein
MKKLIIASVFLISGLASVQAAFNPTVMASTANATSISGPRNRLVNGEMLIDQTHLGNQQNVNSAAVTYSVDGFAGFGQGADGVFNLMRLSSSPPTAFSWYLEARTGTQDSSIGATQHYYIRQAVEGYSLRDFGFGTVTPSTFTLSFWVKASSASTFGGAIKNSAKSRSYPFSYVVNTANTWEFKAITIIADNTGTWLTTSGIGLEILWDFGGGSSTRGTAGSWQAGDFDGVTGTFQSIGGNTRTLDITGTQLEIGRLATNFEFQSFDTTLANCQRQFEMSYDVNVATAGTATNTGQEWQAATAIGAASTETGYIPFKTMKRSLPTILLYDVTGGASVSGNARWYSPAGVGTQRASSIDVSSLRGFSIVQTNNNTEVHCLFQWTADSRL